MNFNERAIDFEYYFNFLKETKNKNINMPPIAFFNMLYGDYYLYIEQIFGKDNEMLELQESIYEYIIPMFSEILPPGIVLKYTSKKYHPFLYLDTEDNERIGKISLADKTFVYKIGKTINELNNIIIEIQDKIQKLEEEKNNICIKYDYHYGKPYEILMKFFFKKHYIKKAAKKIKEINVQIDELYKEMETINNEIYEVKRENKKYLNLLEQTKDVLKKRLNIKTVIEDDGNEE